MLIKRQALFSLQSGHPDKGGSLWREVGNRAKTGAKIGGFLGTVFGGLLSVQTLIEGAKASDAIKWGLGLGAAAAGIITGVCALTAVGAKGRLTKARNSNMDKILDILYTGAYMSDDTGERISNVPVRRLIIEDGDPTRFVATFAFENGKGVVWLNKPGDPIISWFNKELEDIIAYNRYADYVATKTKEGYVIEIVLPNEESFAGLIYNFLATFEQNISCITRKTLDVVKGTLKRKDF